MVEIRVSPERLESVASSLNTDKEQALTTLRSMISTVQNLQGEWTGLAQVDYARLFEEQVPRMQTQLEETLTLLINEMKRIAQVFRETDAGVL
ncbi:MAG: hypothetical protein BWY63_01077 [Chloroflexi bacterium ADurb.Bin360]|nr:MAG: hypothetical protein BWY63_01077 [Chloroflexi bacterium ADurb.Bin360]